MKEGFIAWTKQTAKKGRKRRRVVKKPQGHTNKEDRRYNEGKCTKLWGLNIPAGAETKGNGEIREEKSCSTVKL